VTSTPNESPLPSGWRLRLDTSTRIDRGGAVVFGGSPLRVIRLSERGAALVQGWREGAAVGEPLAERRLARRLTDAGLAHPDPPTAGDPAELTVVVPVRDRAAELSRCLSAIGRRSAVIVVDDGSSDAAAIDVVARAAGARVVRLEPARGPAAARNAGLRAAGTPFVAFVDSDCVVGPDFPGQLLDHLADPAVAIAVPRIVALESGGGEANALARYEARRSALDMGEREALVRPNSPVPYAPSAAMVARTDALGQGFAEDLGIGEDVDLIWRLTDAGWRVRYDPSISVAHDHRVTWRRWFARRVVYDTSSAKLARRHPDKMRALTLGRGAAVMWTALALGHPGVAAGAHALDVAVLARTLRRRVSEPWAVASRRTAEGRVHEGRRVARTLTGPWLPFLLAATAARPRSTRRVWAGIAIAALADRHDLGPRLADDLARCVGTWLGCAQERTLGALLPRLRR
jgi:mycofactocin system glycosyltransferase